MGVLSLPFLRALGAAPKKSRAQWTTRLRGVLIYLVDKPAKPQLTLTLTPAISRVWLIKGIFRIPLTAEFSVACRTAAITRIFCSHHNNQNAHRQQRITGNRRGNSGSEHDAAWETKGAGNRLQTQISWLQRTIMRVPAYSKLLLYERSWGMECLKVLHLLIGHA